MGQAATGPAREPRGLSHARTSFVGRSAAVDKVAGLLAQYRLVTVTGPGGVGKTRLADEVLRQVAGRYADGVWVAELAAVAEPALVPAMVATALRLHQAPGVPVVDALGARLARQQLLLVLDNCEHVLDAVAQFCATVLLSADDIRILATSREPLGLPEEARYRLPPLELPRPSDPDGPGQAEAVRLFAERARQVDPDLALDGEAGAAVTRLVQRLDGMPLAIELVVGVPRPVRPGCRRSRRRAGRWARGPAPGRLLAAAAARGRTGRAVALLHAGNPARVRPAPARTGG